VLRPVHVAGPSSGHAGFVESRGCARRGAAQHSAAGIVERMMRRT